MKVKDIVRSYYCSKVVEYMDLEYQISDLMEKQEKNPQCEYISKQIDRLVEKRDELGEEEV